MSKKPILTLFLVFSLILVIGCARPICETNENCGEEHYLQTYCDGNQIKKDRITYTCVNPATKQALCRENRQPELVIECNYPYKCESGECKQKGCHELINTVALGAPTTSRVFFGTPKIRNTLNILVFRTGAEFDVHLYTDKDGLPNRRIKTWGPLTDEDIDDLQWVKLSMNGVEGMPAGYYWIGIEVKKYGNMAFNTCVTNDREEDTYSIANPIENGEFVNLEDIWKSGHDLVHLFE